MRAGQATDGDACGQRTAGTKKPGCNRADSSTTTSEIMNALSILNNPDSVATFSFGVHAVRALTLDGSPWFVAADVCEALDLDDTSKACSRLDCDEKGTNTIRTPSGDQQMLEYAKAGEGARLSVLLLHDDAKREYAYGPAQGLPATKVGEFTQALYDQANKQGWTVVSMKNDWKQVFSFEP